MMTLPRMQNLAGSAQALHRAAELLGALQRLTQPPRPAYLELGLQVFPEGLASGPLPAGGRLFLDLAGYSLVYVPQEGQKVSFPIGGRSQAALFGDVFGTLSQGEIAGVLPPGKDLFERVAQGIAARGGRYRPPTRERLLDETAIRADEAASHGYYEALQIFFDGIARFLARLSELKTPLVVWPEHFDLSTLLFPGSQVDESQPHLNFGFAPYSSGMEFPYLYIYAYPTPDGFTPSGLPSGAHWTTQGWTGVWVEYAALASNQDGRDAVDRCCRAIYQVLRPVID